MSRPAESTSASQPDAVRIGVSSCLLGSEVRFDGQHKRDRFLTDELGRFVEWVAVCPELEIGMGVPREPVRLVRDAEGARMLGIRSAIDWSSKMRRFAAKRVADIGKRDLCGYVLKANSPSCGMERVKLYDSTDAASACRRDGVGIFAAELMRQRPTLPVEEEGRLNDARLRDNFIERVFAFHRLQRLWRSPWKLRDLIAFHTNEKMALLAHSTVGYRELGRLVAAAKGVPRETLRGRYEAAFMDVLGKLATPGRQANVLEHMMGHLEALDAGSRAELAALIEDHRKGLVPLIVPITLLRHHVRQQNVTYLLGQSYLEPHPKELMLRNRV